MCGSGAGQVSNCTRAQTSIDSLFRPQGVILESNVMIGTNWCQDAGIYEFDLLGDKVKARYSFIYKFEDGEWKISQHHSSVMPEASKPQAITEEEVKNLFQVREFLLHHLF